MGRTISVVAGASAPNRPSTSAISQGLATRWRINLAHRVQVRAYEAATMRRPDGRIRVRRTALSLGVDLALTALLRQSDRPLLWLRVPLDAADAAIWGADIPSPPETPTLTGVPLALEAGGRYGWAGLVVPAATYVVLAIQRRRRGQQTPLSTMGWQVLSVGASVLLDRYETQQRTVTDARAATEAEARRSSAYLAGQNEVAMGADSVVDELGRVEHVLATLSTGHPGEGTARALSTWKANLAQATVVDTVYLGTFLARWERARRQPDLSADIVIEVPAGAGTTILTSSQAAWLANALDALQLRGPLPLTVAGPDRRVPGDPLELQVGDRALRVPGDTERPPRDVDPRPVALAGGFWWALSSITHSHGHVRPRHALPAASLSLGLAWWARQRLDREQTTEHRVLLASLLVAGVQSVILTAKQRELFNSDGLRYFPVQQTLLAPALFAATYRHRRTGSQVAQIAAATAAAVAASVSVAEPPRPRRDLALALPWVVAAYESLGRLQAGMERANQARAEELAQASRAELERAWVEGRRSVVDLVESSWTTARRRLAQGCNGDDRWVDPAMAAELSRRLDAARVELDALRWDDPT